ncbi:hypothetical protein Naga_100364g3 [Nannochloropsis gaditana]|uniref:Uncharacterized protein n=1 Tax=Nannochloropsis gaditana TaxID=72520 RepID=W7TCK3_9STRA|nr:hypothetical protein Naga_100364g3 [Nannochloropsis gaditana]
MVYPGGTPVGAPESIKRSKISQCFQDTIVTSRQVNQVIHVCVADAFLERFEGHGDRIVRNVGTGRDLCGRGDELKRDIMSWIVSGTLSSAVQGGIERNLKRKYTS